MKKDNLLLLKEKGFNVPKFDVIPWENRNKEIDTSKYKGKYAIRSSSSIEDSENYSFAGQFDTYLNVETKDINFKVKECFNSLNNQNIETYLKENGINADDIKMDVIIQEMVNSDFSGVIFTSNPQGLLNETVIVVGKGLGNNIVEDKIDTTTYYYNNTDNIYYFEGKDDFLSKDMIDKLLDIVKGIKELLGDYLDVEYSICNGEIYILQVRPITTLNDNNLVILDNSNIVESYPGVSSPLTISFVHSVYSNVFKNLIYRISKNKKIVEQNKDIFNNMVASSNGRIYYKISSWYALIKYLPFSKKIIPIWQDMMGVKNKNYDDSKVKVPFFTKVKIYVNTYKELKRAPKNMDILNNKFLEINEFFYNNFNSNMTNKEVIKLYKKVEEEVLDVWDVTLVNDLYAFIYTGLLKKRLVKKNLSDKKINEYISGISNIESVKPIKSLIELAYQKEKVSKEEYDKMFNEYIKLYGDRSLEELKLESSTFRTNHKLLELKVDEYSVNKEKLEKLYNSFNKEKNNSIKEDFKTRTISKKAMIGIKNREISRLNRSRIYGMVRSMFLQIGSNLVNDKLIDKKEDVFYLTIDELFNNKECDYKKIIKLRKIDYDMFNELPNYSRLIFMNKEFDKHHLSINNKEKKILKDLLEGTPTSNGKVEGEALVIKDINNIGNINNKILITKMTDPGWVFLIANAKGVISEKGSLLSHTAIISREIGIPSIVGVEDATTIIHSGDYIKMDAYNGTIEIIKRSKYEDS